MEKRLQNDLVQAMKAKDAIKLETIREIKTAITYFKASPNYKGECTDSDILGIIQKVYKQHIETRDAAIQNKRSEMMYKEQNISLFCLFDYALESIVAPCYVCSCCSHEKVQSEGKQKRLSEVLKGQYESSF